MRRLKKDQRGYSLVELLTCITIIMLLVALAIPVYNGTMQKARQTAHDANVRKLSDVAEIWVMNNPGVSAIWTAEGGQKAGVATAKHEGWMTVLKEWPKNPFGGTYVVEIDSAGRVSVSPDAGVYE